MARAAQDKAYRNFVNGFITEATGLTFPENSLRDVDNCDIELKGTIRRRLGLDKETGSLDLGAGLFVPVTDTTSAGQYGTLPAVTDTQVTPEQLALTCHPWPAPGGDTSLNFIVFQIGHNLKVFNWDSKPVASADGLSGIVTGTTQFNMATSSLQGFAYGGSRFDIARTPLQSTSGYGRLWITGPYTMPTYLEYDRDTKTLALRPVGYNGEPSFVFPPAASFINIRDFGGVDDGLAVDNNPTTLSHAHDYNLHNQGWPTARITDYKAATPFKYPSNAQQWILGKDGSDVFTPALLIKQDFGNSPAPRGKGIIDALRGDRRWAMSETSSYTDLQSEPATKSFVTCAFFAGRLWLSGDENPRRPGGVYFSKVMSKVEDAGQMMQDNDPTAEHFSDLLATDGGVIYIPESNGVQRLIPFGAGLLVMAANGIWFIYGGEGGFTATNYSCEKVSSTGILSASSVAQGEGSVIFFAENSIHVVALPEKGLIPQAQDIAQAKIFTYYGQIDRVAREHAQACYDPISKKVFWSWLEADNYDTLDFPNFYNRMLVLDTRTGAFSKYSFPTSDMNNCIGNGPAFPKRKLSRPVHLEYVAIGDEFVVDSGGEYVTVYAEADTDQDFLESIFVLHVHRGNQQVNICEFFDDRFRDHMAWDTGDIFYGYFTSYLITGDEIIDDLQRNKQATFLHSFFKRTEDGYDFLPETSEVQVRHPSECLVTARWDWTNTIAGGRWSDPQAAYRYVKPYIPTQAPDVDTFDNGREIIYTKLKIRGKGRALTLKYESTGGTDFQLQGYSVAFTANGV